MELDKFYMHDLFNITTLLVLQLLQHFRKEKKKREIKLSVK